MFKANPLVYLFSKEWKYSKGNRKMIVLYWALFIVANVFTVIVSPFLLARIMYIAQHDGVKEGNLRTLWGLLALTVVADVLFWSMHGPGRVIEFGNAFKAKVNYLKHLIKGTLGLPLSWHAEHHSGDSIDKIHKGTTALDEFASSSFRPLSLTAFIITRFDKVIMQKYKTINDLENKITATVFDIVSNITTIIILRVEKLVFDSIAIKVNEPYETFNLNNKISELKWCVASVMCAIMKALVLGSYFYFHHDVSPDKIAAQAMVLFLLIKYLDEIEELFFMFTDMYSEVLQRKSKVMNAEILASDFRENGTSLHVLPPEWQTIDIKDLNFSYPNKKEGKVHVDNISMTIWRGKKIALIGKRGCGKSTLLKLFLDLHKPEKVTLLVDGKEIKEGFKGIERDFSLAPQEPEIFDQTIRENITLGAPYDDETIHRFVDMVCFTEDMAEMPNGLKSSVNEKGVNLSGGQKQSLALARALLASQGKSVICLDEPTSSIDSITESKIYENIDKAFANTTLISSVHRLNLIPRFFDYVYMFDKGRIIARGTFEELLDTSQEFRNLWQRYNNQPMDD